MAKLAFDIPIQLVTNEFIDLNFAKKKKMIKLDNDDHQ
jgi:hypothetical protein